MTTFNMAEIARNPMAPIVLIRFDTFQWAAPLSLHAFDKLEIVRNYSVTTLKITVFCLDETVFGQQNEVVRLMKHYEAKILNNNNDT